MLALFSNDPARSRFACLASIPYYGSQIEGLWVLRACARFNEIIFHRKEEQSKNWDRNNKWMDGVHQRLSSTLHVWSAVVQHFQNHLIHSVSNCELSMYVDDRQLYSIGTRIHDVEKNWNNDGNDVSNWYTTNLLQGNFYKYQAISLGRKSTNREINVVIMDTEVTNYP